MSTTRILSLLFHLYLLSLISLIALFAVDATNGTRNHNVGRIYGDNLGLSRDLHANIVKLDPLGNASKIVEKKLRFPKSFMTANCDGTSSVQDLGHHVGYCKVSNTKRMFYSFFESTKNDPNGSVVIWLNGGPGCSSSIALFYENGPFKLTKKLTLIPNEYSWNNVSNIIYLDQPIGTGFSYTKNNSDIPNTSEEAGVDFYNFVQAFFEKHPEYSRNELYIAGEKYAGHFIPAFAAQIQKGNKENRGRIKINLKGMAIGSGWTDPWPQYKSYREYAKMMNLINQSQYDSLNYLLRKCSHDLKACGNEGDLSDCIVAKYHCGGILDTILYLLGNINDNDIRKNCTTDDPCKDDFSDMELFLNQTSVRKALGVDESIPFVSCSEDVYHEMGEDFMKNLGVYVPGLLEDGMKVLIYTGEYNLVNNWIGNLMWVKDLKWSGQRGFKSARNVSFMVDGANAGQYKSYGNLTFLKVKDAGNMVLMDQPKASLEMLRRWTKGFPL